MKPEEPESKEEEAENPAPIAGDIIGDTAYSERFVLKLLLKLANLDSLKDELQEKSFEDDLCTLRDMTAERDVVLFLQKHDVLNLFNFALPVIESPRIIEIIIGIVGNMCCQKEAVTSLLKMESFLMSIFNFLTNEDSLILVQILRLVSSGLYQADEEDVVIWMDLFEKVGYSTSLCVILKCSSNKDLLVTALENLNTVCSYCNIEKLRAEFFKLFVTTEAIESLSVALEEVVEKQKELLERDELERMLVICLQITLHFVGFDRSAETYENHTDNITKITSEVIQYYEKKFVNQKEVDTDLIDVLDSVYTILDTLQLCGSCDPIKHFTPCHSIWKSLKQMDKSEKNGSNFEDDDKDDIQEFSTKIRSPLSALICLYIEKCSETNLLKVLDDIGNCYDEILSHVTDEKLKTAVSKRTADYRTRLKNNGDS